MLEIADRLSVAIQPWWQHRALVIFTLVCTGRPTKKAGDTAITERVTIEELVTLRDREDADHVGDRILAKIAGQEHAVRTWRSSHDALLVLFVDEEAAELSTQQRRVIEQFWHLADTSIQHPASSRGVLTRLPHRISSVVG